MMFIGIIWTQLSISFALVVLLSVLGCAPQKQDIQDAKSILIEYTIKGERKQLPINDANQVKAILDGLSIDRVENRAPGWIARNNLRFRLQDDKEIKLFIAGPQIIDRPGTGVILLKDTKFYDKINEIISKKEGKKIDVLEDNK